MIDVFGSALIRALAVDSFPAKSFKLVVRSQRALVVLTGIAFLAGATPGGPLDV